MPCRSNATVTGSPALSASPNERRVMHLEVKNETVPRDHAKESEVVPSERGDTFSGARLHDDAGGDGLGDEGRARCDTGV